MTSETKGNAVIRRASLNKSPDQTCQCASCCNEQQPSSSKEEESVKGKCIPIINEDDGEEQKKVHAPTPAQSAVCQPKPQDLLPAQPEVVPFHRRIKPARDPLSNWCSSCSSYHRNNSCLLGLKGGAKADKVKGKNKGKNKSNSNAKPRISLPQRFEKAGILEGIGSTLGGLFGHRGMKIGSAAGKILGKITGTGDYKVQSNSIMDGTTPAFAGGDRRVSQTSFIANVSSSTGFALTKIPINPFYDPVLQAECSIYEEWELHGMMVFYKPTSGNALNSTNAALGKVVLAAIYDPSDPDFTNMIQMENYEFASSGAPSTPITLPIECKKSETTLNKLYVRNFGTNGDPRFYDFGNLYVGTTDSQAAYRCGEIWIAWDITFRKRRVNQFIGYSTHYYLSGANSATSDLSTMLIDGQNNSGITLTSGAGSSGIYAVIPPVPVGTILRTSIYYTNCTSAASPTVNSVPIGGSTALNLNQANSFSSMAVASTTSAMFDCYRTITTTSGITAIIFGLNWACTAGKLDVIFTLFPATDASSLV